MMTELCAELHNYFCADADAKRFGVFNISDGKLSPSDFIAENQYFRIIGSLFNDGVYKNTPDLVLDNETFNGAVWLMRVPKEVEQLSNEIDAWKRKYEEQALSPFASESFGGYSYSKSASGTSSSAGASWQSAFESKLKVWRKL